MEVKTCKEEDEEEEEDEKEEKGSLSSTFLDAGARLPFGSILACDQVTQHILFTVLPRRVLQDSDKTTPRHDEPS
jgi:hypothetical protein